MRRVEEKEECRSVKRKKTEEKSKASAVVAWHGQL
jgi:hypothetical protein